MSQITFITGNPKKAEQLSRYLSFPVGHQKLDIPEIQSMNLEEVATEKAKTAYEILKTPVLVEDTAVTFLALNGLPGPLIKWFFESLGNAGVCKLLNGYDDRRAVAQTCFALCDKNGVKLFKGSRAGSIAKFPMGEEGNTFGWNPIFIPEGSDKTWAQMDIKEQSDTSLRRLAIEKLQKYLEENFS